MSIVRRMPPLRFGLPALAGVLTVVIAAVLLLGNSSILESRLHRSAAAAGHGPTLLTDDNLVDTLGRIPLQSRIGRVRWEYGILSVDLTPRTNDYAYEQGEADIRRLAEYAFGKTVNVRELLVRLYPGRTPVRPLLMSAYARRGGEDEIPSVSLTPSGLRFFGNFAN